jgi:hypothetical protein
LNYAFSFQTLKKPDENKELLFGRLIAEKDSKTTSDLRVFNFTVQGKTVRIKISASDPKSNATLEAEQLSVDSNEVSKKQKPVFKNLNLILEHQDTIKDCV